MGLTREVESFCAAYDALAYHWRLCQIWSVGAHKASVMFMEYGIECKLFGKYGYIEDCGHGIWVDYAWTYSHTFSRSTPMA